jgi:dihydroorotate dehydrogenase (NAD+) catalytic subunit
MSAATRPAGKAAPMNVDLRVNLAGVELPTPVLGASGCFGFGRELAEFVDLSRIGGVVTKSISREPRQGRPTPRMAETPSGMLNAIGLQNPGVEAYCANDLPFLAEARAKVVTSIFGHTVDEFALLAERLSHEDAVHLLELNLSCPNADHRDQVFAADPWAAADVVASVKHRARQPVLAKLTADVTDLVGVAKAVVDAGADGLVLINTLLGMAVDVRRRRPALAAVTGGLSGPAIRPIAVRCVWQVAQALPGVPIVGTGGIATGRDAAEFLLVGATAVAVGTAAFVEPRAPRTVADELAAYLASVELGAPDELAATFKAQV